MIAAVDQHVTHAHLAHVAEGDFDGVGGHEALYLGTTHHRTIVADVIAGIL
jgi:hypothetical protein